MPRGDRRKGVLGHHDDHGQDMAEEQVSVAESPNETPAQEPTRVLIPSALGSLGIEFRDTTVTSLTIVPDRARRKRFTLLKDIERSDFLDEALGRLSEYFAGARQNLDLDFDLGPAGLDALTRTVLQETSKIPYGSTMTYQKLAAAAGAPDAYRLVRSMLMINPLPIFIPCHRVAPRKGGAGSYIGGTKKKQWLLKLEQRGVKPL